MFLGKYIFLNSIRVEFVTNSMSSGTCYVSQGNQFCGPLKKIGPARHVITGH